MKRLDKEFEKIEGKPIDEYVNGKRELAEMERFGKEIEGGFMMTVGDMRRYFRSAEKRRKRRRIK